MRAIVRARTSCVTAFFSLLLDLDELPLVDQTMRLFAHNRFSIFSFHDKDHGIGEKGRAEGLVPDEAWRG